MRSERGLGGPIQGLIIGAAFIGVGSYGLQIVGGTYSPLAVLGLWRAEAGVAPDRFGLALMSLFQWLGVVLVVTAPVAIVMRLRRACGADSADRRVGAGTRYRRAPDPAPAPRIAPDVPRVRTSGVRVVLDPAGQLRELRIGPRAGLLPGSVLLGAALGFAGAGGVAYQAHEAPVWVVPTCIVAALILFGVSLRLLAFTTSLRIDEKLLTVRKGPMGLGPTRRMPRERLAGAVVRPSGTRIGSRRLHNLFIVARNGEVVEVTDLLRDRTEADWIADLIRDRA